MKTAAGFVEKTKANFSKQRDEAKREKKTAGPGRVMSAREAAEIRESYEQALCGIWDFMDAGLKFVTTHHRDPEIWSTIDEGDLKLIVDARLSAAQHNPKDAARVHRTIDMYQKGAVYLILGPRMWQSLQYMADEGLDMPLKNPFRKGARRGKRIHVVDPQESEYAR